MSGVGTEIKRVFKRYRIAPCQKCLELADRLDRAGVDWCRGRIDWIVEQMKENAKERRIPFSFIIARRIVNSAIKRAERKQAG